MRSKRRTFWTMPTRLVVDVCLLVAFLGTMDPGLTGVPVHEWLSLLLAGAVIVHLLASWTWIAGTTRRIAGKMVTTTRLSWWLNVLLFADFTLITFTGLVISEAVLPAAGLRATGGPAWRHLHAFTADVGVLLIGLHLALNWDWVVRAVSRYAAGRGRRGRAGARPTTTEV